MGNVIDLAAAREQRADNSGLDGIVRTRLPADVAMHLLSENGWRVGDGPFGGRWTAPDGDIVYGIDEALEVALTAECRPR
jgi:hypothetical protein